MIIVRSLEELDTMSCFELPLDLYKPPCVQVGRVVSEILIHSVLLQGPTSKEHTQALHMPTVTPSPSSSNMHRATEESL